MSAELLSISAAACQGTQNIVCLLGIACHQLQVGSPEVVSGIARRALSVIREAAQATQAHSHHSSCNGTESRADSLNQGAGVVTRGNSAVYTQGSSQGITCQDTKVHI